MRKLFKIKIETDDDGIYRFTPDADSVSYGAQSFSIKASEEMLIKFLRRCRVADDTILPRSYRAITYAQIVQFIVNNKGDLYVFSNLYPKTHDDLIRSMS